MLKIAICDDSHRMIREIEKLIDRHDGSHRMECDFFYIAEDMLHYMKKNHMQFDLYFLDIEMPGISGIELAKTIRNENKECIIIFITSHEEYIYDAFDVRAFNFIKKPIDEKRFNNILQKAICELSLRKQIFSFQYKKKQIHLECPKIKYFESNKRKMLIYTEQEEVFEYYDTVKNTLRKLRGGMFLQCHASYIVNMNWIDTIEKDKILLKSGETIPISKKHKNEVQQAMHIFFMRRI